MNILDMFAAGQAARSTRWEDVDAFIDEVGHDSILPNSDSSLIEEDAVSKIPQTPDEPESISPEENALYKDCVLAISQNRLWDVPDALSTKAESQILICGSDKKAKLEDQLKSRPTVPNNVHPGNAPSSKTATTKRSSPKPRVVENSTTPSKVAKKVFKCPEPDCGKVFERRYNLKVHTRRHTGETPYHCMKLDEGCKAQFRWRSSLRHHMKTVHNDAAGPIMKLTSAEHTELLATVLPQSAGFSKLPVVQHPVLADDDVPGGDTKACLSPITETPPHRGRKEIKNEEAVDTEDESVTPDSAMDSLSRAVVTGATDDVQFASPLSDLIVPCERDALSPRGSVEELGLSQGEARFADSLFDGQSVDGVTSATDGRDGLDDCEGGGWDNKDISADWESPLRPRLSNAVPELDKEFF